jgi:hypothetical protein
MRKSRYQKGSVKKQDGRWVAMWWVDKSHKSRVIGLVKDMTKSEARGIVDGIVTEAEAKQSQNRVWAFGEFVEEVYFPYYSRKWKASTRVNNMNRVRIHLVDCLGKMVLGAFKRDGLQDVLDDKARNLSFSTVDHLRWDLKQVLTLQWRKDCLSEIPRYCCSRRRTRQSQYGR